MLYGSIALLVTLSYRAALGEAVWLRPVVFAAIVGLARVYRGMHHLTDVVAGALLGIGSLLVATVATRASAVAADAGQRATSRAATLGDVDRA